jgi:threonine dehydrogenase-like Zn-dependent dehydrogenase
MRTVLIALLVAFAFPALAEEVDVELVLAADGSGSIDNDELALQRRGYAEAITSAEVLAAIGAGPVGAIAITYVEWGGAASQHTIVDWHVVRDAASAAVFADKLVSSPRQAYGYNSISGAIAYAADRIRENGYEGLSKVIDVSGDGPQIGGPPLAPARAAVLAEGITINGLVIARPGGGVRGPGGMSLSEHYARDVIGGPASFVMVAEGTGRFADAVRRKLIQEIALAEPVPQRRQTLAR